MKKTSMKIMMIDTSGYGGIAHYSYNLSEELAKILNIILVTNVDYELENHRRNFTLMNILYAEQSYLKKIYRLFQIIINEKPDIVHIQTLISARKDWFFFILARLLNLNIVFTVHNVLPHEIYEQRAFGIKASLRVIYRCPKKIIVHSQYSKDRLISLFKVLPEKIEVIYHGNYLFVRTKELSPEHAKEILGIPQNKKVILQFGTIRQYKGLDTLIHAFKRIRERTGNVFLLTVGKPFNTDITYFKNLINELNLTDDVILKDQYVPLEEIPSYFFASDLVVFPYKEIDMSGSLQLAYAFSKPVIAAKVGGLAEVVEDGKNGVFVEPDNIDALEKAMEKILFQDELMKKMGDFSFDLARKKFSWEKIANDTINLYRNALDQ